MIINHPLLGPRDSSEFVYLGDASLINRPDWKNKDADKKFYEYQYLEKTLMVFIENYGITNKVTDLG